MNQSILKQATFFLICLFPAIIQAQAFQGYKTEIDRVVISLSDGNLSVIPLTNNAFRVKFSQRLDETLPELILTSSPALPVFKVTDTPADLVIKAESIRLVVNKKNGTLSFSDGNGKIFLKEKEGSRKMIPDSIMGVPCYLTEQAFESTDDESIFGLGQFQDGHYNLRGVTRRLTQVNSQIAIPIIYSSKGYGLLWHQYGLTDFNPADNFVKLEVQEQPVANNQMADVTTTAGTQRRAQGQSFYSGSFTAPQDGEYSIFLDLGDMGNRHYVTIDGKACIDQSNMWLPPTASARVKLKAGKHEVHITCKADNKPKLSWKLIDDLTTFRSPNAKMLDYVVFSGTADEVISAYRDLSGKAPLFPLWAYGFWQCRERYTSGSQLVATVKEFRERKYPMDVIVQDWQYWGNRGWGVPQFDETNYSNPAAFIKEIHDLNAHFNISIWSNPDKNSEIGKEYVAKKRFIGESKWLDYFNPETRKEYWNTLKVNMFDNGVDSWWMDAVEPENDALRGERTFIGPGELYRLTYPLMVSQAVYEGQRESSSDKRVCILTRSAFPGQQRYGIINWSGDIGGTWDTYRRQIVAGLNFTITGLPYWTTDIGGFFRPGRSQYTDEKFHELLLRWHQWSVFNPIFRMHAYQTETEPWKYGKTVEENMKNMTDLRYRLIPYIYSEAYQVSMNNSTMMRPLVMDFMEDSVALNQPYQFMFGKAFLVAPITEEGVYEEVVYLPGAAEWFDFWTGKSYTGGQSVKVDAPLDKIPLFVRSGSILPMGKFIQYSGEKLQDTLEIRIYKGADGNFELYEDENDNYNYEKGAYSTILLKWDDSKRSLTIDERKGSFPGMLSERQFNIVIVNEINGSGIAVSDKYNKLVTYKGRKTVVRL